MTRNDLLNELSRMSSAERILLAQDLWDSVADDPDAWQLTAQQRRELDRRLKAFRARAAKGTPAGATWRDAKRRIQRKA